MTCKVSLNVPLYKAPLYLAAIMLPLLNMTASAQTPAAAPPPVSATQISEDLYLMTGGGGANSSVLVGDEGVLVVDSKLDTASAEEQVGVIGSLSQEDIRFLINTHVHPDHTGGNLTYGERGAIIIAQQETRDVLAAGQRGGPPAPAQAMPVITFTDEPLTLHLNGETIIIRALPAAHTSDNSLVQYVNANVFHAGDVFSTSRYPLVAGGTFQGFIDSAEMMLDLGNEQSRFIPGNGDVTSIDDVRAYRDMLIAVRDQVAALIADGKSLEEVVAASPTAGFDATWGSPERMLPALYNELNSN